MLRMGRHTTIPGGIMQVQTFAPRSAAAAASWWVVAGKTCVAAYQPKGAASLAASYVNLANPGTYDAAEGVAPSWAAGTGWTFNGTSHYLNTGLISADTERTLLVRFSDVPDVDDGILIGDAWFCIKPRYYDGRFYRYNDSGANGLTAESPGEIASGVLGITQTVGYRDGASDITYTATHDALGRMLCIGAGGNNAAGSTAGLFLACAVQAMAIYSGTLTGGEVASVSAAMAAL